MDKEISNTINELNYMIGAREYESLSQYLNSMHPMDVVEVLNELEGNRKVVVFKYLNLEIATEVFEDINPEDFYFLFSELDDKEKYMILEEMSKDDIVDKLYELTKNEKQEVFRYVDIDDKKIIKKLLAYDSEIAGGIMTSDYVVLKDYYSKDKALDFLKDNAPEAETIYYTFVIDENNRLVGVVSLRELIIADDDTKISDIMNEEVIKVYLYDDQEDVAKVVSKYDLLAVPVVNDFEKLVGIVTIDDVLDVIEEEATEDILKFAGSSEKDILEDKKLGESIMISTKARLPWLIITVFGGLMSASIVNQYQGVINAYTLLALFMPLLAGMGGNVGTQSSTITVRNIALNNLAKGDVTKIIFHEVSVGALVGITCSILVAIAAFLLKGDPLLSVIVGVAMISNIVTATIIGTLIPLFFDRFGIDPAVASAPFITTTVDITGLSIYFSLATVMINKWM